MEQTFCLDEIVICLQEKKELKEAEGPGDDPSSQSFAERFWYLHLHLMPQLFLLLCPSEGRQNLASLEGTFSGAWDGAQGWSSLPQH